MKTFREIKTWQKSMDFITKIYKSTKTFPKEEMFGITNQMRRSAVPIPSNITEGFGRKSATEFKRFLNISMGSLFELQTQLEISRNIEFIKKSIFDELYKDSREIEIMLSSFIKSIR